jgi:TM2 domain-containing membrane protein YozV
MDIKLKASYKAALLSLFLFPGLGHIYLKRYGRGLVIMFLFLTGLGYIIWFITVSVINRLDDMRVIIEGGTKNPRGLPDIVGSKMLTTGPYQDVVFYIIICFWIFAVIDAYRIGRQNELQDKETSQL